MPEIIALKPAQQKRVQRVRQLARLLDEAISHLASRLTSI